MGLGLGLGLNRGSNLPPGGAWTPAKLSPLMWLTASASYCFSDAGGATPCNSGDALQFWKGRAAANNATQATALNRPTFNVTSGVSGVVFNGTSSKLGLVTGFDMGSGGAVYFVHKTTGDCALMGIHNASNPQYRYGQAGNFLNTFDGTNVATSSALTTAQGNKTVSGVSVSGTTATFYENGNAKGTGTYNAALLSGRTFDQIGAFSGGSNWLNGTVYEIVVLPAAPSSADRANLDAYFRNQWGTP